MEGHIDISELSLEELSGVVNIYPWYAAARKELFLRVGDLSGGIWEDCGMYLPDQGIVAALMKSTEKADYSDKDIAELLEKCVNSKKEEPKENVRVRVVGGDYFSQADYENVRKQGGEDVYASFKRKRSPSSLEEEVCTETLAQIYAEQGYFDKAKDIYSKLILAYPEKSAYFAALIEKLEQLNN